MSACAVCGTENPNAKRFCKGCGAPLSSACPSCGAAVEHDSRFCGDCGAALVADGPVGGSGYGGSVEPVQSPLAAGTQVAELRVCSVLFVDLVGFTPFSESRDPEEVRELLSVYFERAKTIIVRYGGVVEKFIGDAVMAVWGTPIATEGDAERAVRAALDVVAAVEALGQELGASGLAARAGVVTGEVAVTIGLGGEGVAGDAVNTAARVQTVAGAGSVWVDASTYRLAGAAIGFDDVGEHALKGKTEPLRLWVATRVLSGVGGAQRVDGLEAPLVGRDAELRTVKELFHACAERRTPRLVVVSGPPGVGKSRIGWEFEKYVDGLVDTIYWHRGRCLSYGEGVAFWALTEIVRQRLGIAEEDPLSTAAAKLAQGLETFVPDESERAYIGLRLARLLGVTLPGDSTSNLAREELFAGWRLFFERLADIDPVMLLIEDAQNADSGLLDFVDHLVDWARDSPIFVLVFTRPELDQSRPRFGTGRNRSTLTLDPLDDASMDSLINALVPDMPTDARAAIRAQAEGIPLFAVETVRSLVDRDIVVPSDGVYRMVGELGELSVPDGLRALLAARLDALDADLRALVAEAAVLGTTFPAESLVAVSLQPEESVRAGLAELLRREVLSISADRLSPQRGDYSFAQDLLRQVAYETMTRRERKSRHLAVATHLRSTLPADGDEVAEVISRHYLDALSAMPDAADVDEIRAEAIGMLVRSAERAGRAGAPRSASSNYAVAAEQTELTAESANGPAAAVSAARLWELAARAAEIANDIEGGLTYAERAELLYAAHGHDRASARCQAVAGELLMRAGRFGEARERLGAALAVLRPHPDADTVTALERLAAAEFFSGGPDGDRLSAEALILGQAIDVDSGLLADLFTSRAIAVLFANRPAEGAALVEYAARLAEGVGDGTRQARALLNLAEILNRSDPAAGAAAARTAADLARRRGAISRLSTALSNQAEGLLMAGEWDEADQVIDDVLDLEQPGLERSQVDAWLPGLRGDVAVASARTHAHRTRGSEDAQDRGGIALADAIIAAAQRDYAAALVHAEAVTALAPVLGISHGLILWGWPLATRCAHDLGDHGVVSQLLALLDAHPVGHIPQLLRAERLLARARAGIVGDAGNGAGAFDAAVAALRQAPSPYHLAHGLLDQAAYLAGSGDETRPVDLVAEARAVADRLRCQPLLHRADRVLPSATGPQLSIRDQSLQPG